MVEVMRHLFESDPDLCLNFSNSSYPMATFNLGSAVTIGHTDFLNMPGSSCAISSVGDFDPKKGGHLVLFDFGIFIEFPPGSTILLPSGCLRHGNTAISPGETRYSMTQYFPGGLARWVRQGDKPRRLCSQAEKAAIDGEASLRYKEVMARFSRLGDLEDDLKEVFGG
jgi:hypothetical protein